MKIRFQGKEYLFINKAGSDDLAKGGAIATEEQFVHGRCSYAHLHPDGVVRRFGRPIGVRADVEIVDHSPLPKQTDGAILSVLFSDWKEEPSVDAH